MVIPPVSPACPVCGMKVSTPFREQEAKLETDLVLRKEDHEVKLSVIILHCTSCGNIMLFSRDKLPIDEFPL
ncbi:MAG: hypothetical protein M3299_11380 [Thermoproteota archaeon]|nr:hypothetical protein [Thermoproteota archaeon]